jgi:hypothetical protein
MLFLPKAMAPQLLLSRIPGNHAPSRPKGARSPRETPDTLPGRIQGSQIIIITNLNWPCSSIYGEHGRPDNFQHGF